jgi:hypothetical protein
MTQEEHEEERKIERANDRTHDRRRWIYPLAAVFVSMFVAVGVSMAYTYNAVRQSDQNWCEIVVSLDNEYTTHPPPPSNLAGVTFAAQMHRLRAKLHCS